MSKLQILNSEQQRIATSDYDMISDMNVWRMVRRASRQYRGNSTFHI